MNLVENPYDVVLITGITGSGGSYLAEHIVQNYPTIDIHGISRWHSTTNINNLESINSCVEIHECDLNDLPSVYRVINQVRPEVIFHLASHANVRSSFDIPISVLSNNVLGTANLLEAVRMTGIQPVIQICSTSEVYGQVEPSNVPIDENCPIRPVSPYAVSKATQDLLGRAYFASYGTHVIITRMFTYINPRRTDLFATSFAKQIAWIEHGLQNVIVHGNLDSVRTLIDVRDAMSAYWKAVVHCEPGETYNIGGVTTMTVGEVLEALISLSNSDISTREDTTLLRPADVTLQIPNTEKFRKVTGWLPQYEVEESLQYLIDYWRDRAQRVKFDLEISG